MPGRSVKGPKLKAPRVSAPGPQPIAAGTAPATVATDVIRIGRSRTGHAVSTASVTPSPRARSWFV